MVATFGPEKWRAQIEEMIGPRAPIQRPNTGTNRTSRRTDGHSAMATSNSMPAPATAQYDRTPARQTHNADPRRKPRAKHSGENRGARNHAVRGYRKSDQHTDEQVEL